MNTHLSNKIKSITRKISNTFSTLIILPVILIALVGLSLTNTLQQASASNLYSPGNPITSPAQSVPKIYFQNVNSGLPVYWKLNTQGVNLSSAVPSPSFNDSSWKIVSTRDMNLDGITDYVFQNRNVNSLDFGNVAIWNLDANGNIKKQFVISSPNNGNNTWELVGVGLINNDSIPDLVWQNTKTSEPASWFLNTDGIIIGAKSISPNFNDSTWRIAFVGNNQLFLRNSVTGIHAIWNLNANGELAGGLVINGLPKEWRIVALADANGDSILDIILQNLNGQPAIWYQSNTPGVFSRATLISPNFSERAWEIISSSDIDGDKYADFIMQNRETGEVVVWFIQNTQYIKGSAVVGKPGNTWKVVGSASDVN
jgi:FG-GAP-like repeat